MQRLPSHFPVTALLLFALCLPWGRAQAVVGGETLDTSVPATPWSGVVAITPDRGGVFSGVLIDARHVLTAAHVVFRDRFTPARIRMRISQGPEQVVILPAEMIFIHPDYLTGNTARDEAFGWHDDLAVVRLAGPVPEWAHVFPLSGDSPAVGAEFSFAGFGADADPATGSLTAKPNAGVLRLGRNRVERLMADDEGSGSNELLLFAFDPPPPRSQVFKGARPVRWIAGEAQLAGGDSGCPLFLERDGLLEVAAIAAFNGATPQSCDKDEAGKPVRCEKTRYGAMGGATLVAPQRGWLSAVLAGHLEPGPDPDP